MWWMIVSLGLAGPSEEAALSRALQRDAPREEVVEAAEALLASLEQERAGRQAFQRAVGPSRDYWLAQARDALWRGDPEAALTVLAPLRETEQWSEAAPVWEEAVDLFVRTRREEAGERYLRSRELAPALRFTELMAVRSQLLVLVQRFPGSAYAPALAEDLARIEREAELVEQRAGQRHAG